MKTSELKKIVEDNKFIFVNSDYNKSIFIYKNLEDQANYRQSSFISKQHAWFGVDDNMPKVVAQAILDYAYTPLSEREEISKYYLKLKNSANLDKQCIYLNYHKNLNMFTLSSNMNGENFQTIFTDKDIKDLKINLYVFEKEEVK